MVTKSDIGKSELPELPWVFSRWEVNSFFVGLSKSPYLCSLVFVWMWPFSCQGFFSLLLQLFLLIGKANILPQFVLMLQTEGFQVPQQQCGHITRSDKSEWQWVFPSYIIRSSLSVLAFPSLPTYVLQFLFDCGLFLAKGFSFIVAAVFVASQRGEHWWMMR